MAPPETPTTLSVAVTLVAVPMARSPRVERATSLPISTFVATVAVVFEASPPKENTPPLQVPTLSSMKTFDSGRMLIPPGASRLMPEVILTPSPIRTREPVSIVTVLPPVDESPAEETTPPPLTTAEWPLVVRRIVFDEASVTIPELNIVAPAATTARASAVVLNVARGRPPAMPPPK